MSEAAQRWCHAVRQPHCDDTAGGCNATFQLAADLQHSGICLSLHYSVLPSTALTLHCTGPGTALPPVHQPVLPDSHQKPELCTLYRCAIHWDDAALRHELVMRPVGLCNNDNWHWSGGFQLSDKYALLHYQSLLCH